jgi:putative oxidoreductase
MKFLNSLQPLSLLLLRIALGVIFLFHGYPKLAHFGNFQGFFVAHGLPGYFVYISGILETFGGGLLILGLFMQPVALLLAIEMCVAIWKVHSGGGYMAVPQYEFPLTVMTSCFVLATVGAGLVSCDHLLLGGGGKSQGPRGAKK